MRFFTIAVAILLIGSDVNAQGQRWIQLPPDLIGEAAADQAGHSVSLSANGSRIAIGAPQNDDNGEGSGHVRVYEWNGGPWIQLGADIDGESVGDMSGFSVSLSSDGSRVAIGAPANGNYAGHTRIYEWTGSIWIQIGGDIDGYTGDYSGNAVSLSSNGEQVVIGCPGTNGQSNGKVRVYSYNGSNWIQVGQELVGEALADNFGYSVCQSNTGNRIAVGATTNDGNGSNSGHVRVFELIGNEWIQIGSDIDGENAGDSGGFSISMDSSGNTVAIGSPASDGGGTLSGQVRVFSWNNLSWNQLGQNIEGLQAYDFTGSSVGLSNNANLLVVGSRGSSPEEGRVTIYQWSGNSWTTVQTFIGSESGDQFGDDVSVAQDGSRLAVGVKDSDQLGSSTGSTRIFQSGGVLIVGKVYQDYDLDHELDAGEPLLDGQIIQLTADDGSTKYRTTTVNGEYYFAIEDSGTYVVSYDPPSNFIETGGVTSVVLVGLNDTLVSDVNFGVGYTDTIVDVETDLEAPPTQIGTLFGGWISTTNIGTVTTDYSVSLSGDVLTNVSGVNPTGALQPGQTGTDVFTFTHPSISTASITADVTTISNLGVETALSDNRDSVEVEILYAPSSPPPCCPYDPNDKTVFGAYCEANYVEIGDTLEYRIRFMNTGTAPANTVVLIDTLDASVLDLRTFRVIGYSHPMYWDISGPGKLTITYPDINLPDSSVSFLGSQGFFKFRVVMRDTVSNLTQSGSSAFIYFDNEAPIETNEPTIIAVDSIPVSELTATDAICGGESGLIDASISFGIVADSAYWGNGSTGLPLPYNDEGTYTVELVDEYGCRYLDSIAVSCNILTSIDENGEEFSVYPNPSNGKYYVNAKGNIRAFDVSGKEVYQTSSFNAPTEVDLSALPSGIYTIQLTNKGGVFTGKVVRE